MLGSLKRLLGRPSVVKKNVNYNNPAIIVVNDFSQSRRRLENRLRALVDQVTDDRFGTPILTTTLDDNFLREIPGESRAQVMSAAVLASRPPAWAVLTSDQGFHLSSTLAHGLLTTAQIASRASVVDMTDPLINGMGLKIQAAALPGGDISALLLRRIDPGLWYNSRSLLEEGQVPFATYCPDQGEVLSCYRNCATKHMPLTIQLETSTRCNYSCLMCPYHGVRQKDGRRYISPGQNMDLPIEAFKELVAEVGSWEDDYLDGLVRTIVPYRRGEPLMYPHFREAIRAIKDVGASCYFATNGQMLGGAMNDFLVEAEVDHFKVSMHGASPETYAAVTGREMAPVVKNLIELANLKKARGKRKPEIGVVFAIQDANKHEMDEYVRFWLPIVDYVALSPENRLDETTQSKQFQKSLLFFEPDHSRRPPCSMLIDYAWVNAGLDAIPCIGGVKESLGVVGEDGVAGLLRRSELLKTLKQYHLDGQYDRCQSCLHCQTWYGYMVRQERYEEYTCSTSPVMKIFRKN